MSELTKADAQHRVAAIAGFREELARLQDGGVLVLDDAQATAVRAHHAALLAEFSARFDIDVNHRARQLSLGMRIVSFFGALALAASVFFLFYQFWGLLHTPLQVAILVAAPLLLLALTAWWQQREAGAYFARLTALVAFACFVLNLSMLAQIFNIAPSAGALLAWAALALLLAYAGEQRLLLVAGLLCLVGYGARLLGGGEGLYGEFLFRYPEHYLPWGALLFLLPQYLDQRRHAGFAATYRVCGLVCVLLPVLVLGQWGALSRLGGAATLVEVVYQLLGFTLSALAIWLGIARGWPDTVNTGAVFFLIFLGTRFFDWWWDWMPKWLFFLVIALSAILLLLVFQRWRGTQAQRTGESA